MMSRKFIRDKKPRFYRHQRETQRRQWKVNNEMPMEPFTKNDLKESEEFKKG